jgi:hypothetical protein
MAVGEGDEDAASEERLTAEGRLSVCAADAICGRVPSEDV